MYKASIHSLTEAAVAAKLKKDLTTWKNWNWRMIVGGIMQIGIRYSCQIHVKCSEISDILLQRDSEIFTASRRVDQKYDAYKKDIAIVSFYFNHPSVFEYTRYIYWNWR